jgi:hypothetical protein
VRGRDFEGAPRVDQWHLVKNLLNRRESTTLLRLVAKTRDYLPREHPAGEYGSTLAT